MEEILHYVWKYKLYPTSNLTTTEGIPIHVIDPGIHNMNSGPDFFNAKIRISGTVWAGCIEIHTKASDWYRHKHDEDPAYDSVILHVVQESDQLICRSNGELLPQAIMQVPERIQKNATWLLSREQTYPCLSSLNQIEHIHLSAWMDALLTERLHTKTQRIFHILDEAQQDWNTAFYITLARNFGFGINSEPFEQLARSLPLAIIRKHRDNVVQTEALFFGQAGFLDETDITDDYYKRLQQEYLFLQKKYTLEHTYPASAFKRLRTRPGNFPHLKIAQLAALCMHDEFLFSRLLEADSITELKQLFTAAPSAYWKTHFHFRNSAAEADKPLSSKSIEIILINTAVPILFAYSIQRSRPEYNEKALRLLEALPPEKNAIVSTFAHAGLSATNAGESQALIQLRKEYCDRKKCLYCRIGHRILKRKT